MIRLDQNGTPNWNTKSHSRLNGLREFGEQIYDSLLTSWLGVEFREEIIETDK